MKPRTLNVNDKFGTYSLYLVEKNYYTYAFPIIEVRVRVSLRFNMSALATALSEASQENKQADSVAELLNAMQILNIGDGTAPTVQKDRLWLAGEE